MNKPETAGARVRLERDGAVAVIVNPPVNAGSWEVRSGIADAIAQVTADPAIKAAVLIGAGSTFIAGADIREFGKPLRGPQTPDVIAAIEQCPKPVVAAIHGAALGGGYEVALGCDARVAAADAAVGLPEVHLGMIPGAGGTQRMPRLTGVAKAIELVAGSKRVRTKETLALGLIDAVAEGDLRQFAAAYAARLSSKRRVRELPVPSASEEAIAAAAQAAARGSKRNPVVGEAIRSCSLPRNCPLTRAWPRSARCSSACARARRRRRCAICSSSSGRLGASPARMT